MPDLHALEIGPGRCPVATPEYRWKTAGVTKGYDYAVEWGRECFPVENGAFDFVYGSHVIEHIPWYRVEAALTEVFRILRPGGLIELWTPDFEAIVGSYVAGTCGDDWRRFNAESNPWKWRNGRLFAYEQGADASNWHRSSFDYNELAKLLLQAGFDVVKRIPRRQRGTGHGPAELGVTARKR